MRPVVCLELVYHAHSTVDLTVLGLDMHELHEC